MRLVWKQILFFYIYCCLVRPFNWIVNEPIWKRCHICFRTNINKPLHEFWSKENITNLWNRSAINCVQNYLCSAVINLPRQWILLTVKIILLAGYLSQTFVSLFTYFILRNPVKESRREESEGGEEEAFCEWFRRSVHHGGSVLRCGGRRWRRTRMKTRIRTQMSPGTATTRSVERGSHQVECSQREPREQGLRHLQLPLGSHLTFKQWIYTNFPIWSNNPKFNLSRWNYWYFPNISACQCRQVRWQTTFLTAKSTHLWRADKCCNIHCLSHHFCQRPRRNAFKPSVNRDENGDFDGKCE